MKLMNMTSTMTMSSLEIAELTGKEHKHVLRDIREMIGTIGSPNLDSKQYQVFTQMFPARVGMNRMPFDVRMIL